MVTMQQLAAYKSILSMPMHVGASWQYPNFWP